PRIFITCYLRLVGTNTRLRAHHLMHLALAGNRWSVVGQAFDRVKKAHVRPKTSCSWPIIPRERGSTRCGGATASSELASLHLVAQVLAKLRAEVGAAKRKGDVRGQKAQLVADVVADAAELVADERALAGQPGERVAQLHLARLVERGLGQVVE